MPNPEALRHEIATQAKDLLQEQLSNLSARLFELGKKADQQLTTWMAFAALTRRSVKSMAVQKIADHGARPLDSP